MDLVRRIRDDLAQQLAGKSSEEIIAFFRQAGEEARKAVKNRPASKTGR